MELYIVIGFLAIGVLCGILSGFFGVGGGILMVPTLMFMGIDIKYAIGISIIQMIFSSIVGSIINHKKKLLDYKEGLLVAIGGAMGASMSGIVVGTLSQKTLIFAFLCFAIYSLYKYVTNTRLDKKNINISKNKKAFIMVASGVVVGIFSSSLGMGGGLLLVPILNYYLGFDSKKAAPISLFFVIFSSISGSVSLAYADLLDLKTGLIVGIGSMVGVWIGIKLITKTSSKAHKNAVIVLYLASIIATSTKLLS